MHILKSSIGFSPVACDRCHILIIIYAARGMPALFLCILGAMSYVLCLLCVLQTFFLHDQTKKTCSFLCRNATVSDLVNVQHAIGIVDDPNAQSGPVGIIHLKRRRLPGHSHPSRSVRWAFSFIKHVSLSIFKLRFICIYVLVLCVKQGISLFSFFCRFFNVRHSFIHVIFLRHRFVAIHQQPQGC